MKLERSRYRREGQAVALDVQLVVGKQPVDIDWSRHGLQFFDEAGGFLAGRSEQSVESIEAGHSGRLRLAPWVDGAARHWKGAIRVVVASTLCRVDRVRLTDVPVPADGVAASVLETRDVDGLVGVRGLAVRRWTEQGQTILRVEAGLANQTDSLIEQVALHVALVGSDERPIEETVGTELLRPHQIETVVAELFAAKPKQLKDAKLRIWLELAIPVAHETVQGALELGRVDDFYHDVEDLDDPALRDA